MKSRLVFLLLLALVAATGVLLRPRVVYEPWETTGLPPSLAVAGYPRSMAETLGGGVAVLDFDGDGLEDILVSRAGAGTGRRGGVVLYRNLGDESFVEVTAEAGLDAPDWCFGLGVGDFNADGRLDFYLARLGEDRLFVNEGGHFRDASEEWGLNGKKHWGTSVVVSDFDSDGRLDVFVACHDLTGLGLSLDTVSAPASGGVLYLQRTAARFESCELPKPLPLSADAGALEGACRSLGATALDVDRDGSQDILLSCDVPQGLVLLAGAGKSGGTRGRLTDAPGPHGDCEVAGGLDWGDLNGDGHPEVVATRIRERLSEGRQGSLVPTSLRVNAAPTTDSHALPGCGVQLLDVDNDGDLDVFVAGGYLRASARITSDVPTSPGHCLLYLNGGGGHLREVSSHLGDAFAEERLHRGAAAADFNRDGRLDLVVERLDDSPAVLWNRLECRHWLRLRLQPRREATGRHSPPEGIGARVALEASGKRQVRWVRRTAGYLSSREATLHFGLGDARRADRLRIYWPSGETDEHGFLEGDREYVALEGGGIRALRR